jgi:hypothetical protein
MAVIDEGVPPLTAQSRIVAPGPNGRSVRTSDGEVLQPPEDWVLLPPGDATLTRRVKAAGPSWTVQEKVGRKTFSHGVWAPQAVVEQVRGDLTTERTTPQYQQRRAAGVRRRQREQADYVEDFRQAVLDFLAFDTRYADLAGQLAEAVTAHATPVGSGTVARTQRISVERRAEAAVIAWLRHQTTAYDDLAIPRVKGRRREVRRLLAAQSRQLLDAYRRGEPVDAAGCPLQQAFFRRTSSDEKAPEE